MINRFLLNTLLLCSTALNATNCEWTQAFDNSSLWDNNGVAISIDGYWLGSELEIARRQQVTNFVANIYRANETFLEVGCGTGLIYSQTVPNIIPNDKYTGVDSSKNMLAIAKTRHPKGNFKKDDLFDLSLRDNTYDVVAALEVYGHLHSIEKPIAEMFRVAKRLMVFTVWTGEKTQCTYEHIEGTTFVHWTYTQSEVLDAIARNVSGPYSVATVTLPDGITGFLVFKQ